MTLSATDAAVPAFLTVADTVIALVSIGEVGVHERFVTVRSGFGAGTPMTWNSATCPPGAPVLAANFSWTSATVAAKSIFTELPPEAGLKV